MSEKSIFKVCPMCSTEWETRDEFLDDQSLDINGYGANLANLELSLFYFTHIKEGCFSTMALYAKDFLSLYTGQKYSARRTGEQECPGFCLNKERLDRCSAPCECAFNREVIQIIKKKQNKETNLSGFIASVVIKHGNLADSKKHDRLSSTS